MKKRITIFVVVVLLGVGIGLLVWNPSSETEATTEATVEEVVSQVTAELRIDGSFYTVTLDEGATALDLMENVQTNQEDFTFEGSESEYGFFVEEINGVANNTGTNEYWSFYVNDALAEVGVSSYALQQDDVITWKYEKVTF